MQTDGYKRRHPFAKSHQIIGGDHQRPNPIAVSRGVQIHSKICQTRKLASVKNPQTALETDFWDQTKPAPAIAS